MREAASRGFWVGSTIPYGYSKVMVKDGAKKRPTLEPDPDTSPVVKRIFDLAEAGKGMLNTTRTLNGEGIASPTGKLWSKNGVHYILKNEVYTGAMVWGNTAKDKAEPVRVEKAFPAIVSKAQFRRVAKLMRSRAPKVANPRRVSSSYLLSGLVKCHRCNRALSGQDAKSGQFAYYVCQSLIKRGSGACDSPRLNARRFEELVVGKIRSNILTEGSITDLVKAVDEEMDGVAREQRKRLETIDSELADVRRRLDRLYNLVETTDMDIDDFRPRIRDHRERQERLEDSAAEARAILAERRSVLDDVNPIAAYAQEMRDFLVESELTERRAFIESLVKEGVVTPDDALMRYTVPMPDDSLIPGRATEKVALNGAVLPSVKSGGLRRYGYRHPIARHEPAMESRPSSVALGRRGGCVASRPGLPLQRHVPFAPRHLEGAGARDAASRASGTAVAVVKPELCFLPTIPQQRRHSHRLAEPAGDDGFHHSDHFLNRPVGRFVAGVAATIGEWFSVPGAGPQMQPWKISVRHHDWRGLRIMRDEFYGRTRKSYLA